MSQKIILIVKDNVSQKFKTFLDDLSENNIKYHIERSLEDALDYRMNYKDKIDIVVLDMRFPILDGNDVNYYAGAELMPKLIRHNNEIVIILNTPADKFLYKLFPENNVIYVSKRNVFYSTHIKEKMRKTDSRVLGVLDLLKK